MKLLSLDQASRVTGWAFFEDEKLKNEGKFTLSSSLDIGTRLSNFYTSLTEIYGNFHFDTVAFEDIQLQAGNVKTYKMLAMIQAMVIVWCHVNDIEYHILSPSHWRKTLKERYNIVWGRKRVEQKQVAIDFVKTKYGLDVDSDAADAICLGTAYILEAEEDTGAF